MGGRAGGPLRPSPHGADPRSAPPGKFLEPHKFAALQKLDDPGEICTFQDIPSTHVRQAQHVSKGAPGGADPRSDRVAKTPRAPTSSPITDALPDLPSRGGMGCGLCPHDPEWPPQARICTQLLTLVAPECSVSKEPFVLSCQADVAAAPQPGPQNSSCATLSEYSRQCSMVGQPVRLWRGPGLCCESREGSGRGREAEGSRPSSPSPWTA